MSDLRPESRISAIEKRVTHIEGTIEEHAADTAKSLKLIRQDIKKLDEGMMKSFKQIGDIIIDQLNPRLARIEATMATKDDMSKLETRFSKLEETQQEILALLKAK